MNIIFYKYQGTGNDFIIIDNRTKTFPKDKSKLINKLCDRNFGIGADGLLLLEEDKTSDFKMVYFNADGYESTMCGNGGRCIVAFANKLGLFKNETTFNAIDGLHFASINNNSVSLQMIDVEHIEIHKNHVFTNTGSPHHVELVSNLKSYDVYTNGKRIRHTIYEKQGANINFVEKINDTTFNVRTYERGVENETLACGTGVTAVAIAMHATEETLEKNIILPVQGGELSVRFKENNKKYSEIFLTGPATFVFKGEISI